MLVFSWRGLFIYFHVLCRILVLIVSVPGHYLYFHPCVVSLMNSLVNRAAGMQTSPICSLISITGFQYSKGCHPCSSNRLV